MPHNPNTVTEAYIECAIWASTNERGEPIDRTHDAGDLTDRAREAMRADVEDFLALIEREGIDTSGLSDEQMGHDFWLTRNRHGAGFWDRGLGELGDKLTALAHPYGEAHLMAYDGDLEHYPPVAV